MATNFKQVLSFSSQCASEADWPRFPDSLTIVSWVVRNTDSITNHIVTWIIEHPQDTMQGGGSTTAEGSKQSSTKPNCPLPSILGHVRGKHSFQSDVLYKMVFGAISLNFYKSICKVLIFLILLFQMRKLRGNSKRHELT